jgi:hypothetical protein
MSATFDFQALAARAPIDQPEAALHGTIEILNARGKRFRRAMTGKSTDMLEARAKEWSAAEQVLADTKPTTLEGLLLKLRYAEAKMLKAPIFKLQAAAMRDAIEWLDPPKPKGRAKGGKR